MKILALDVETTVQIYYEVNEEGKKRKLTDNSPYNPKNRLVSVNWRKIENDTIGPDNHSVFYHNDCDTPDNPADLQEALDWADEVVAHNAKYDVMWLTEAGFKLPERVYCTYIGEYILARGVTVELSLEATAKRRKVTHKKSELIDDYWDNDIGFEKIPLPIVLEYADADVLSCAEIYLDQMRGWKLEENISLINIVRLMNDMLMFIVDIERNGICVDLERLDEIDAQYAKEQADIIAALTTIAQDVMGDSPFNLRSGVDISKIVFSREVKDRELHVKTFNIGVNEHGKKLYTPYMTPEQFNKCVLTTTKKVYRTTAEHCHRCHGKGWIQKVKVDGTNHKRTNKCPACGGAGFLYIPTTTIAGLKLVPANANMASANGFSVEKETIDLLIDQAKLKDNLRAVEFLTKKKRLNAINTYRNSFVKGIKRWVRADNLLHAGFNQCITKTARLSSSNPNFQNQPKGKKFPIRGAIISRWKDYYVDIINELTGQTVRCYGEILESDFSGLEFVVAGELSRDPQIIEDILAGKDIHRQTASIVFQKAKEDISKDERNSVKPETFKPLYGGTGNAFTLPHIKKYYDEFFNIYSRHKEWQLEQMDAVIKTGKVRTPSGREYRFPNTVRIKGGRTTNSTMIVNYPVQGFATGDIVPLACIRVRRRFKELGLKSLLILTVHDSIVCDVYPGERDKVANALKWAMTEISEEIKERWNYTMALPLKCEMASGPTWMDGEVLHCNDNNEWETKVA